MTQQFLQEIIQYKDKPGVVGDLAREMQSILDDQTLTQQERADLLNETVSAYNGVQHADKEIIVRWAVAVAQIAAKAVV